MIWGEMLNKMVQIYPQFAAGAPPPPNCPANKYMGISPPDRGTNDDISFIIYHPSAGEEDADEGPEEVSTPLIDQYRDEIESYKKLQKLTIGNFPLKW